MIYNADGHFSQRLGSKTPNMVHFTIIITFLDGWSISYFLWEQQQQQIERFNDFNISVINALMIL